MKEECKQLQLPRLQEGNRELTDTRQKQTAKMNKIQ